MATQRISDLRYLLSWIFLKYKINKKNRRLKSMATLDRCQAILFISALPVL